MGWQIAINARIGFKLQDTATLGFHSHYDWCFQTMWLFSGTPEDPEDETGMEKHGAEVKSFMHAIRIEDYDAQQDAAQWMIQIVKPWMIRRWSESNLANRKQPSRIPKENAHLVDLECTAEQQAKLETFVEIYPSPGAPRAWRVHRWWLAWFSLVLGDTEDWNYVSRQWYNEWPIHTSVDSPIFRWLRDTVLPMLVDASVQNPEPDQTEASNEALLHIPGSNQCALPFAPPPQKVVLFCPPPGLVCHLKWWLTKLVANHLDILNMYAEMGSNERTDMQQTFRDSPNPYVNVTTPKLCGTDLNLTGANHAVMTQRL